MRNMAIWAALLGVACGSDGVSAIGAALQDAGRALRDSGEAQADDGATAAPSGLRVLTGKCDGSYVERVEMAGGVTETTRYYALIETDASPDDVLGVTLCGYRYNPDQYCPTGAKCSVSGTRPAWQCGLGGAIAAAKGGLFVDCGFAQAAMEYRYETARVTLP
jgi:hypothetical protein